MLNHDKCWWMTTTEDGGQTISRSSSMGYNMDLMMMTMMMLVVVVREDASIFFSRRRWRLVICLTFIRIFSKDTLMMAVIVGERRSRLFTIDDPLVRLIHFSTAFCNDSLHHRITDRVHQRDGASVWAALTASLSLRPSTTFCFPQIPPCNYHIFTRTPMYSNKFPHDLSFIPTTLHQMTKIIQNPRNHGSKGQKLYYALRTGLCHPKSGHLV